jgi:hypothetical protein
MFAPRAEATAILSNTNLAGTNEVLPNASSGTGSVSVTVNNPGGEIRGQLAAGPEPATLALMLVSFGLVGAAMRRRQLLDRSGASIATPVLGAG